MDATSISDKESYQTGSSPRMPGYSWTWMPPQLHVRRGTG